jgi:hypothetical protein
VSAGEGSPETGASGEGVDHHSIAGWKDLRQLKPPLAWRASLLEGARPVELGDVADDVDEDSADNEGEYGHSKVNNPACQISVRDERR